VAGPSGYPFTLRVRVLTQDTRSKLLITMYRLVLRIKYVFFSRIIRDLVFYRMAAALRGPDFNFSDTLKYIFTMRLRYFLGLPSSAVRVDPIYWWQVSSALHEMRVWRDKDYEGLKHWYEHMLHALYAVSLPTPSSRVDAETSWLSSLLVRLFELAQAPSIERIKVLVDVVRAGVKAGYVVASESDLRQLEEDLESFLGFSGC